MYIYKYICIYKSYTVDSQVVPILPNVPRNMFGHTHLD